MNSHNIFTILFLFVFIKIGTSQNNYYLKPLNPEKVKSELEELFIELSTKHPGFYRYNEKSEFDEYIDSTLNTIDHEITSLDLLRKLKPIFSKIGCLHTGIHLSDEIDSEINASPNCLPLALHYDNGKAIVWKIFGEANSMKIGTEIVEINGKPIHEIYGHLFRNIPMDGYNETGKYKLLQYSFSEWYRNIIEIKEQFTIKDIDGETHTLNGVKSSELPNYEDIVNAPISLKIQKRLAVIKIPSFSNSYLKRRKQKFKREIKSYLKSIENNKIETILFDLRNNTGGSDSNPAWFASFFFNRPFRYWEKITVAEPIAKDVSGLKRIFYGKAKKIDEEWHWGRGGLFSKEFKFTKTQNPVKRPFRGKVFILTNGLCMSSCADFVAIMQFNEKALIIGEETGGGYQGNTSGLIPSEELECGLVVDVPLLKYENAVDKKINIGRGTIPDIKIKPSLEEIMNEELYLEKILKTIKEQE